MDATLVVIVVALVGGAVGARWAFTRPANRKLVKRRRQPVGGADGLVRVTGRARPVGALLQAPISGRQCLAYEIVVRGAMLQLVLERREVAAFAVEDQSGEMPVDTSSPCELSLEHDLVASTNFDKRRNHYLPESPGPLPHPRLIEVLRQAGIEPYEGGRLLTFSYGEGILGPDELVSVGGIAEDVVDPTGERPDLRAPPQRRMLHGTDDCPLLISDAKHVTRRP